MNRQKSRQTTISGRDYSEQADGRIVFSREYLLARGTCCGSDCQNCPFEFEKHPPKHQTVQDQRPVISMVPSWTETLIFAGANVVGRTRFCIHPNESIRKIKAIGGTKNVSSNFEEAMNLIGEMSSNSRVCPLVILDKEENPKEFEALFLNKGCEVFASEVTSLQSFGRELMNLSELFPAPSSVARNLHQYADRLEKLLQHNASTNDVCFGFGEALFGDTKFESPEDLEEFYRAVRRGEAQLVYVIWKSPWMCVGPGTYIESVLQFLFRRQALSLLPSSLLWTGTRGGGKYPEFDLEEVPESSLLVYSSEPFPFSKDLARLRPGLLVDGERLSWFGIRSIRYLENLVESCR